MGILKNLFGDKGKLHITVPTEEQDKAAQAYEPDVPQDQVVKYDLPDGSRAHIWNASDPDVDTGASGE